MVGIRKVVIPLYLTVFLAGVVTSGNALVLTGCAFSHGSFYGSNTTLHRQMIEVMQMHNEWDPSAVELLSLYLDDKSIMFDIFVSSGVTEISLSHLVPGCRFVSQTTDPIAYHVVHKNLQENNILDRSLLLYDPIDEIVVQSDSSDEENNSQSPTMRSVEDIHRLLYDACPSIVKYNYPSYDDSGQPDQTYGKIFLDSILQSLSVINLCHPVLYIENSDSNLSYYIIEMIADLTGYTLYWHISSSIDITKIENIQDYHAQIFLIAVHKSNRNFLLRLDRYNVFPYESGKYLISDYSLYLNFIRQPSDAVSYISKIDDNNGNKDKYTTIRKIVQRDSPHINTQTTTGTTNKITPEMNRETDIHRYGNPSLPASPHDSYIDVIVYMNTLIGPYDDIIVSGENANNENQSSNRLMKTQCKTREECHQVDNILNIKLKTNSIGSLNYIKKIIQAKCTSWIVRSNLTRSHVSGKESELRELDENGNFAENSATDFDLKNHLMPRYAKNIINSCVNFAMKRHETILKSYRYKKLNKNIEIYTTLGDRRKNEIIQNFRSQNGESQNEIIEKGGRRNYHTELGSLNIIDSKPFNVDYSNSNLNDTCGEPVWCEHTQELQKRLHSWQFPDHIINEKVIGINDKNYNPHSTVGKNSTLLYLKNERRSCQNSKFLIFQNPSDRNGIGSMLHLIVGAFRLSLCLGRIFLLLPSGEDLTLTKWRHPGTEFRSQFFAF